jgi:hypothetical protein
MPTSLSRHLGAQIVREREAHDLSRNAEFDAFQFIGYRTSATAVELVALCDADGMTEGDIVRRRDEFFELVLRLPREYGLRPHMRNPNGLLGFVFAEGCTEPMARFIARQTRISHAAGSGGVSVAWAIDARSRRIHTHENPVSIFPPVIIDKRTVYPGLDYLDALLRELPGEPLRKKTFEEFTGDILRRRAEREAGPAPPGSVETPAAPGKTHILFLAANPRTEKLDLEREFERIETTLLVAEERRATITPVWAVTFARLSQAMLNDPARIVHFSGHGEREGLVLRDGGNGELWVSGEVLARLMAIFKPTVQCVVLNACYSEAQAHAIHQHVPYVIGMRDQVPDSTAIGFSTGFYQAIAAGRDIEDAFELGQTHAAASPDGYAELITLLSHRN